MSKRSNGVADGDRPPKRVKAEKTAAPRAVEEITSARQIEQALTLRQDGVQALRDGIASFKSFLQKILYHEELDDRGRRLAILQDFLNSQRPTDASTSVADSPFLSQLWQGWSFAAQEPNDALCSAIAAVLALVLKTISSAPELQLKDCGLRLCRTILLPAHLRLVKRGLSAPPQKEHVISPCLRLLTEVAAYEEGLVVRELYRKREETFDFGVFKRHLAMVKTEATEEDLHRRPAVRTLAMRYILTYLKYLHEGAKAEVLKNRHLCTGLFSHLSHDPADVVNELLSVTEQYILKDDSLPRFAKAALLQQQNLHQVAVVMNQHDAEAAIAIKAMSWLKSVVTTPSYGILKQTSWYPPRTAKIDEDNRSDLAIDLGLDGLDFYDSSGTPEVRNTVLLGWIKTLRPQSHARERDLLLTLFRAAPELVAAYFSVSHVQLEPKLSNTWLGYASFLFEVVSLPVPNLAMHGHQLPQLPPQTAIMMESILPRLLTQKILTRCLNQSSDLIAFFVMRILAVSFLKFEAVRRLLLSGAAAARNHAHLWEAAAERLTGRFVENVPRMKDITAVFRRIPADTAHSLQREAIAKLIRLYYETMPLVALEEQFDVSSSLTDALTSGSRSEDSSELSQIRKLELEHLLQIARRSSGMRWFSKQGALVYSPIVTLLRLHAADVHNSATRDLIKQVLLDNNIISREAALDALVGSLVGLPDESSGRVLAFVDDVLQRGSRKPVKYLDDLEGLSSVNDSGNLTQRDNLIIAVLIEQAPFLVNKDVDHRTMNWVLHFLSLLQKSDEHSGEFVIPARAKILKLPGWALDQFRDEDLKAALRGVRLPERDAHVAEVASPAANGVLRQPFADPQPELQDHPELLKWSRKDLRAALEEGEAGKLVLCLCSKYPEVRSQALTELRKFAKQVHDSNIEDKDGVYVLVCELLESYEQEHVSTGHALPYLAGTFAARALQIQMDPAHFLYAKLNRYLNKGPVWRIPHLPRYWLEKTTLSPPDQDDAYWKETEWVVSWIVDGLRTRADLDILRRAGVFEYLMNVYASPGAALALNVRDRVLEVLWRTTFIQEGSTTLVTRTGVVPWLQMISKKADESGEAAVRRRILSTCDQTKVDDWSGTGFTMMTT